LSDRDLSTAAGMSPTMVSKIKKWTTLPKLSTLKKLRVAGVVIPKPPRHIVETFQKDKVPL
jgi:predicted transcriptional regulator